MRCMTVVMSNSCLIFRLGIVGGEGGSKCFRDRPVKGIHFVVDRSNVLQPIADLHIANYVAPFVMINIRPIIIKGHGSTYGYICRDPS